MFTRLLLAGALGAAAWLPAAAVARPPSAQLSALVCQRAVAPRARAVAVTAVMRPVHGTRSMQLRVQLLERARGQSAFTTVSGGDLGAWRSPRNPTLGRQPGDVWRLQKKVSNLAAPATYRFRVSYQWIGTQRRILASAVRDTAACQQAELRPDLRVTRVDIEPVAGQPHQSIYAATVVNDGATGAGPFNVAFIPGGGAPAHVHRQAWLAAHTYTVIRFKAAACTAGQPAGTIAADPENAVADFDRSNNVLQKPCPSG